MIKVGDTLPATTLMEYSEVEGEGCSIGPNPVAVDKATAGKTIALFALPVPSHPPARPSMFPVMWKKRPSSRPPAWMKSGA